MKALAHTCHLFRASRAVICLVPFMLRRSSTVRRFAEGHFGTCPAPEGASPPLSRSLHHPFFSSQAAGLRELKSMHRWAPSSD